ncbi:MAG: hypothetical protein JRG76_12670 [Deltaproteobacteria bacterium]|nr:hypothetical protein [Deltaproteobacteria bacterium]
MACALVLTGTENASAQIGGGVTEQTGEAGYTIPLVTPPGTGGTGPALALVYASGGGKGPAGWAGLSWRLDGESRIERNTKRGVPYDYEDYRPHESPPQLCGSGPCYLDDFEVDGADLVCEDLDCASGIYRTRRDDSRRIEYLGESAGWTIHSREGTAYTYGASATHRIVNPTNGQVYAWLLEWVEDVSGNWISYAYDIGAPGSPGTAYLASIEYAEAGAAANRSVGFLREGRTDRALSYRGGLREEMSERLARIEVRAGSVLVTAYELAYAQGRTSGRSLLASVQRFGADDDEATALNPHVFAYSERALDPNDGAIVGLEDDYTRYGDFQGKPKFRDMASALGEGGLADMNGDAIVDWYHARLSSGDARVYASTGTRIRYPESELWAEQWRTFVTYDSYADRSGLSAVTLDMDGDGYADRFATGIGGFLRRGGPGGYEAQIPWATGADLLPAGSPTPRHAGNDHVTWASDDHVWVDLIDMTGDGKPDRTHCKFAGQSWGSGASGWLVYPNLGHDPNDASGFSANAVDWPDPMGRPCASGSFEAPALMDTDSILTTVDVNGDGLADHLRLDPQGMAVAFNNGSGFDPEEIALDAGYGVVLKDSGGAGHWLAELIDLNGDGFLDYVGSWLAGSLIEHYGSPPVPRWGVYFGNGAGFESEPLLWKSCEGGLDAYFNHECDTNEWRYTSAHTGALPMVMGFADFNGDGLPDRYIQSAAGITLNAGPLVDLLTQATSPLGGSIAFTYSTSGQMQVDPAAPVPANPHLPFSRPVVERASVFANPDPDAAAVTDYHYAGGEFDPTLVEFRGFARVERREIQSADPNGPPGEQAGTTAVSTYRVDTACAARPETTQIAFGSDALRSETRSYRTVARPSGAADPLATWNACLPDSVTVWAEEQSGAAGAPARARRTDYDYGPDPVATYYNVERVVERGEVDASDPEIEIPGDERTTRFLYAAANPNQHLVSRLSERWVEDPAEPGATHAHVRLYYDHLTLGAAPAAGRPTRVERWYDNAYSDPNAAPGWVPVSDLVYGSSGSLVERVAAPHEIVGGGTARVKTIFGYDPTWTFVTARTRTSDAPGAPELTSTFSYTDCVAGATPPPALGLVCSTTTPDGRATNRGYDALGRVTLVRAANGRIDGRSYWLPSPGAPAETVITTSLDDPNGAVRVSTVVLDGLGRTVRVEQPGKSGETIRVERSYDERGRLESESLPRRLGTGDPTLSRSYTWDPLGRPASVLDLDGRTLRTWSYAPWQVTAEIFFDPNGIAARQERTERVTDAHGRVVSVTDYADAAGLSDPLAVTAGYDLLDRLVRVDDPVENGAACAETTHCPDQVHTTRLAYDTLDRRVWIDDPDSGEWLFRYDAAGLLKQRTDARGKRSRLEHDALGRLARRTFPGNPTLDAVLAYDGSGRLATIEQGTIGFAYTYDAAGRVETSSQVTAGLRFTNEYRYDAFDRVTERTFPDGEVFGYVYDGARLVSIEKRDSGGFDMFLSADYGALGRMTRLEVARTNVLDPSAPAVTLERSFDPVTARLAGMTAVGRGHEAEPNLDLTLEFDGLGRLETMDGSYGASPLLPRSFTYDGLGRLDTATGPWEKPQSNPDAVTWSYAYDVLGNLRAQNSTGSYTRAWSYEDGVRPRFLTEFSEADGVVVGTDVMAPDAAGNTASINGETLGWNNQNRMTSRGGMSNGVNFFDPFGKRVLRWFPWTHLVYVGDDFEYDSALGLSTKYFFLNGERVATRSISYTPQPAWIGAWAWRWIVTPLSGAAVPTLLALAAAAFAALLLVGAGVPVPPWVSGPGITVLVGALVLYPVGVARAVIGGGGGPEWHGGHHEGVLIYGNDHLGSTRVVMDAHGNTVETRDYAPFGRQIAHTGAFDLKHRFTSQTRDDRVALYNYRARMYEPRWGRFVSKDERTGGLSSQGLSSYAYVGNQPTARIDPTGNTGIEVMVAIQIFALIVRAIRSSPGPGSDSPPPRSPARAGAVALFDGRGPTPLDRSTYPDSDAVVGLSKGGLVGQTTVELRYNETIGPGVHHAYVVLTGPGGEQFYTRAGPSAYPDTAAVQPASIGGRLFGRIRAESGAYVPGTIDFTDQPAARLEVARTADPNEFGKLRDALVGFERAVNRASIPYDPASRNSNSYAHQAIEALGLPRPVPPVWAPGHGTRLRVGGAP